MLDGFSLTLHVNSSMLTDTTSTSDIVVQAFQYILHTCISMNKEDLCYKPGNSNIYPVYNEENI